MAEEDSYESLKAENDRLRRVLLIVVSERRKMESQITREHQERTLGENNEQLKSSLASAENRIMTRLSYQAGVNGQTVAGEGAIVTPGVSKKLLDALTRENTKLRLAYDPLTNRSPSGVDLLEVSIAVALEFRWIFGNQDFILGGGGEELNITFVEYSCLN